MKILILSEYFPSGKELKLSGGVETRNYYVAKNLSKHNKVTIIASNIYGQKQKENASGINIIRVGKKRDYNATTGSILDRLIFVKKAINKGKSLDVDIVEGTNFITHLIAKRISQKNKIPVVYWYPDVFIGQWFKTSGAIGGTFGWFLEKYNLLNKANIFISISKQTTNKLIKNRISSKIIKTIPCGIEPGEFKQKIVKVSPQVIICISRLVPYKNIEDLIWAYALLAKKNIKCSLKIVGTGPEEQKLRNISSMLKLNNSIKFYKNLPRKQFLKLLQTSYILCSTSSVEGFGINVIEAAASGVPYVLSNLGVFNEITKKGLGGLFFKTRDVKDLADQLEVLLTDKYLYRKKQKEALSLAKTYDWKKISFETAKIYQSLI